MKGRVKKLTSKSTFKKLRSWHLVSLLHGKCRAGVKTDLIFLGSKITVYSDCNHKIRRLLNLGRKTMTNLDVY